MRISLLSYMIGVLQYYKLIQISKTNSAVEKFKSYEEKFKQLSELLGRVPFYQCIVFLNHCGR